MSSTPETILPTSTPNAKVMVDKGNHNLMIVVIRLLAVGNAPILKQQVFKTSTSNAFEKVVLFIRKQLALEVHDSIYCYINQAFCPALDENVGNLYTCFAAVDGSLNVYYSITPAWG